MFAFFNTVAQAITDFTKQWVVAPNSTNVRQEIPKTQGKSVPLSFPSIIPDMPPTQHFMDEKVIRTYSKEVIGGFLNLGKNEGWPDGHYLGVGEAFTRFILSKYLADNKNSIDVDRAIVKKALQVLQPKNQEGGLQFPFEQKVDNSHRPIAGKFCYDPAATGWKDHAISRLVGNLASKYHPSKPFFEILINSARSSSNETTCKPFFVTIYTNEETLDKRRSNLLALKQLPATLAHHTFYASYLKNPEEFLKENQSKLGPNSTRILQALIHLQNTTINSQSVGNCWLKQPMRCALVNMYLELAISHPKLTIQESWEKARELYKRIQRTTAISYVQELLKQIQITQEMSKSAQLAIEHRKRI